MKNYIIIILAFLFLQCSDEDYQELNINPNSPKEATTEQLFVSSIKSLTDQMENTNVNLNIFRLCSQYWTQTTYVNESNFDLNGRNISGSHWNRLYSNVLTDLQDAKSRVEGTDPEALNKIAQLTILEVYTWQVLVDTFGDIPYTQALQGIKFPTPTYDDDKEIYKDLIDKLKIAISNMDPSEGGIDGGTDFIYHGDITAWMKMANSLLLKLGMRISEVDPALATSTVNTAITNGVFTSNADSFYVPYEGFPPNTNPLWNDLVRNGRTDFVACKTFIDILNSTATSTSAGGDVRRTVFFQDNMGANTYVGAQYGKQSDYYSFSHIGERMLQPTLRGVLLDYTEVQFMLAEAVESLGITGNAATFYKNGINANLEEWNVSASDIAEYLVAPDVNYTTAPGTWKEKIGKQYWICMYNRGFEGWYVVRKFDLDFMAIAYNSEKPVPTRFTYPSSEQTLNGTNYDAAASAIGGDKQQTKVFWDVN